MKVTIIYDNEVYKEGLESDWGFSCLVEIEETPKILFDTGTEGRILLDNMEKLNIEPDEISEVFISHTHYDHTGGLSDFLKENEDVKIYYPASLSKPKGAKELVNVEEPVQIHESVFSTGKLKHIEQSLVIKRQKGLVVIVGCSHPGVGTILNAASQFGNTFALIGGLHGFREFNLLEDLELVCPVHCTRYKSKISSLYPEKYIEGGAGKIIEL